MFVAGGRESQEAADGIQSGGPNFKKGMVVMVQFLNGRGQQTWSIGKLGNKAGPTKWSITWGELDNTTGKAMQFVHNPEHKFFEPFGADSTFQVVSVEPTSAEAEGAEAGDATGRSQRAR